MKLFMYSIFDVAAGVYDRPVVGRSDLEAVRVFTDMCNTAEHPVGKHPDDYTLFRIGIWDDNSGEIKPCAPEKVINGLEALAASQKNEPGSPDVAAAVHQELSGNGKELSDAT